MTRWSPAVDLVLALAITLLAVSAFAAPAASRARSRTAGVILGLAVAASGALLVAAALLGRDIMSAEWLPQLGVTFSLRLDGLALLFALLVTGVGALVVAYAWSYLEHEPLRGRAIAILLVFAASMLGVVLADDVILLYVFWELTSVTSWLLVGFHGDRPAARAASWQALLVTGGGGLALLAGLVLLSLVAGTSRISEITALGGAAIAADPRTPWAAGLVVAGILTKSAQFPVHGWLPRAMEAPTPVSAYLHAATMVKAGVYLALRLVPVFATVAPFRYGLLVAGGASLLLGATRALFEADLKRVLAYSTISALGLLLFLTALGTPAAVHAALAYTLAHAAYKGALFLAAGAVDHGAGTRDTDRLGGLWRAQPLTAAAAGLAAASMAGIPGGLGYVAKEAAYGAISTSGAPALLAVAVAGSALFVVAAAIAGWRPFLSRRVPAPAGAHEVGPALWIPPLVLALVGVGLGVAPRIADGLLAPAAAALAGGSAEPLALFHGWGTFALSAATLALGGAVLWQRPRIRAVLGRAVAGASRDGFGWSLAALNAVAKRHTALLQTGSLRRYLLVTFAVAAGGVAAGFARNGGVPALRVGSPGLPEVALGGVAIVAALAAVRARSRIAAITALGAVGYSVGLTFLLFGAPDLAMTQIAVETVTVMVFLLAFRHLPRLARLSSGRSRARDAALAGGVGVVMALLVVAASGVQEGAPISAYHVEQSVPGAHGRNVVNTILVDFRGLDTLGEATVLAVAGAGVVALLKLRPRRAGA